LELIVPDWTTFHTTAPWTVKINVADWSLVTNFPLPSMKSDADAIAEYVENYHIRTNLRLIGSNKLAFPHGNVHAGIINRLCRERYEDCVAFIAENECLKDSIITIDDLH